MTGLVPVRRLQVAHRCQAGNPFRLHAAMNHLAAYKLAAGKSDDAEAPSSWQPFLWKRAGSCNEGAFWPHSRSDMSVPLSSR